jgi:hypothetical protein
MVGVMARKNIPSTLIIKKSISPLLKLIRNILRLLMPLKPRLILLMEPPALALQRFSSQELLIRPLPVVKSIKQGISVYPAVQARVVEDPERFLRIVRGRVGVGRGRFVVIGFFGVEGYGAVCTGGGEHREVYGGGEGAFLHFVEGFEEVGERGGEVEDGFFFFFLFVRGLAV